MAGPEDDEVPPPFSHDGLVVERWSASFRGLVCRFARAHHHDRQRARAGCIVIRGDPDDYPDLHPGPDEVALVVEVADSTLRRDRSTKKRIYARAGIPVYWIANLIESRFEVYTDPTGPADQPDYRQRQEYGPDDEIPVVLDGVEVGRLLVRDLLP